MSQEEPDAEPGTPVAAAKAVGLPPQAMISKAEAVRRAISDGVEKPADGAAYVMEHFGIEMDAKTFSLNRSQQKARDAKKNGQADEPKRGRPATHADVAKVAREMDYGAIIGDIETVRKLLDRHGKDGLRRLVEALG